MSPECDIAIVGGGFYGAYLALKLAHEGRKVVLIEAGAKLMQRASRINQARVHQGYHYPRSTLTALRSRENYERFTSDFSSALATKVDAYYSIATQNSKINADQFYRFVQRIGAPIRPAARAIADLFDAKRIEATFAVEEAVFDSEMIRVQMEKMLASSGVEILLKTRVLRLEPEGSIETSQGKIKATQTFLCMYGFVNEVLANSRLPLLDLRYELAEMPLVDPPPDLQGKAFTVMCGPFFSLLPHPNENCYTLSHVRYTPHHTWTGIASLGDDLIAGAGRSHASRMIKDATRYLPSIRSCRLRGSLYELKALLPKNDHDDGRPILVKPVEGRPDVLIVIGGKIDNVYDAWDTLKPYLQL